MENQSEKQNLERYNPIFAKKLGLNSRTTDIIPDSFQLLGKFHNSITDIFDGYVHRAVIQRVTPRVQNAFKRHKFSYLQAYVLSPVKKGILKPQKELIGSIKYYIDKDGNNPLIHICNITSNHSNIDDYMMQVLENLAIDQNITRIEMNNTNLNYYSFSNRYGFYFDLREQTDENGKTEHLVKRKIKPHAFKNNFASLYCNIYGKSYSALRKKYGLPSILESLKFTEWQ